MNDVWATETIPSLWQHEGLDCNIIRVSDMGHLCGYVRIPEGHPLHGVSYNDPVPESLKLAAEAVESGPVGKRGAIDILCATLGGDLRSGMLFDVHGGITFSEEIAKDDGYLPRGFWYGFDCAHAGDRCPGARYSTGGEYRDVAYVKSECESLAHQLRQLTALSA